MQSIYIVEDDDNIREMLSYALTTAGFDVKGFSDGHEALAALAGVSPTLILLDIMLPGCDGLSILRTLRLSDSLKQIPVVMLTAKGTELDRVRGLDIGADDYITKPFSVMEVISRVKAVLRRCDGREDVPEEWRIQSLSLSQIKRTVTADGLEVSLTYKEFELLQYMMINKDLVLSRDKILEQVWGFQYGGETRTVDMHIKTLRQKLGQSGKLIKTVRNVGYKISSSF